MLLSESLHVGLPFDMKEHKEEEWTIETYIVQWPCKQRALLFQQENVLPFEHPTI